MSKAVVKGGALWNPNTHHTCYEEPIDPNNPGDWVMVGDNESFRYWELDLGTHIVAKTECKNIRQMLDDNERSYNESDGQRWGDGKSIGSVPLNIYFSSGLAEANVQRDKAFIQRFWNDPDHRKFRKFRGRV